MYKACAPRAVHSSGGPLCARAGNLCVRVRGTFVYAHARLQDVLDMVDADLAARIPAAPVLHGAFKGWQPLQLEQPQGLPAAALQQAGAAAAGGVEATLASTSAGAAPWAAGSEGAVAGARYVAETARMSSGETGAGRGSMASGLDVIHGVWPVQQLTRGMQWRASSPAAPPPPPLPLQGPEPPQPPLQPAAPTAQAGLPPAAAPAAAGVPSAAPTSPTWGPPTAPTTHGGGQHTRPQLGMGSGHQQQLTESIQPVPRGDRVQPRQEGGAGQPLAPLWGDPGPHPPAHALPPLDVTSMYEAAGLFVQMGWHSARTVRALLRFHLAPPPAPAPLPPAPEQHVPVDACVREMARMGLVLSQEQLVGLGVGRAVTCLCGPKGGREGISASLKCAPLRDAEQYTRKRCGGGCACALA